jgi:hypothetical protein
MDVRPSTYLAAQALVRELRDEIFEVIECREEMDKKTLENLKTLVELADKIEMLKSEEA